MNFPSAESLGPRAVGAERFLPGSGVGDFRGSGRARTVSARPLAGDGTAVGWSDRIGERQAFGHGDYAVHFGRSCFSVR